MSEIKRRSFLTWLGTLPVLSDWMRVFGSTHVRSAPQATSQGEEWEAKFLAVETLRLINTAEKWHFLDKNEHVSADQLHQTEAYKKLVEVAGKGRFKRVVPKLPEDGRIVLAGYEIFVEPTADRSKYVARVSMDGPRYKFAFASDESGGIYEGIPLHVVPAAANDGVDAVIADKRPMGQKPNAEPPSRGRLFAMITPPRIFDLLRAFLPLPLTGSGCYCCACTYFCTCCTLYCVCLSGTCGPNSQCQNYCCYNCGCVDCGCIWCQTQNCLLTCPCGGDCSGTCDYCSGDAERCECEY
jgi:hypothetical protein